jgi:hypothetical protein
MEACGNQITITDPGKGGEVTLICTRPAGHVRYRRSSDHCNGGDVGDPELWQWWNDRGELTTERHGRAKPSPLRTYPIRMSEEDFEALQDFLTEPHYVSSKKAEVLERIVVALAEAEPTSEQL